MPECYVRGSTIKYLRIPDEVIDMVKDEAQAKSRNRSEINKTRVSGAVQNQNMRGQVRSRFKNGHQNGAKNVLRGQTSRPLSQIAVNKNRK